MEKVSQAGQLMTNLSIAAFIAIAYAYEVMFMQVIIFGALAVVVYFALIISLASWRLGSIKNFALLTLIKDTDDDVFKFSVKTILTRFFTYDVPLSLMLVYFNEVSLAVVYLTCISIIHIYFKEITLARTEHE